MSVSLRLGLVYLISELLLTATRRSRSRAGTKQDRRTLRVVWLVIIVSVAAGIYVTKHWSAAALPHHRSCIRRRGALCRWIASALVGHHRTRPLFHRGRDD